VNYGRLASPALLAQRAGQLALVSRLHREGRGESRLWRVARKPSDGNLLPIVKFRVKIASGNLQGRPLFKTCFERSGDGTAECGRGT